MSTTKRPAAAMDGQTRVQFLPGVGPQRALAFERLGIMTLEQLVRHYPRTWLDASRFVKVKDLQPGELLTIAGDVKHAQVQRTRGGRTVSIFDTATGSLLGETGSQLDDAAAAVGIYPDDRSNRGGSEPEVLDLTHYRGLTLVAVGLERANAVALIDVSDPTHPMVISIAPVDVGPEGIKFFRKGNQLFVAVANEVSGTVSILEVVF